MNNLRIELEASQNTPIQIADAICRFQLEAMETEVALIRLEEIQEHIGSIVKACRKMQERKI